MMRICGNQFHTHTCTTKIFQFIYAKIVFNGCVCEFEFKHTYQCKQTTWWLPLLIICILIPSSMYISHRSFSLTALWLFSVCVKNIMYMFFVVHVCSCFIRHQQQHQQTKITTIMMMMMLCYSFPLTITESNHFLSGMLV